MKLTAYAKINWDLHVLGKRADGFHALDMVMVNVSLHDTLVFSRADGFQLTCSDPSLPTDSKNLVYKAMELLAKASGYSGGARIHLEKSIPAGGGMGGGSSDGACALRGLNKLWDLNWPVERLHPLAAELGSDVAFFLYGGWRRCLGRGEIVEPLAGSERWQSVPLLLIMPPLHVATPAVYKALGAPSWDGTSGVRELAGVAATIGTTMQQFTHSTVALGSQNHLTPAALKVEPKLAAVQEVLQKLYPSRWLMSGSGAVHFVVPPRGDDSTQLRDALTNACGPGIRVVAAETCTPEP